MMQSFRCADVYVQDRLAGQLCECDTGYEFRYDEEYLAGDDPCAVSLTLPLNDKPYESKVLFPFFDGLIPEGWLLNIVTHNWKINPNDKFGLLLVTAKDPIGDVRIAENIISEGIENGDR